MTAPMRVIVTGSRSWRDQRAIADCLQIVAAGALAEGLPGMVVVHGCAMGTDMMADAWVRAHCDAEPGFAVSVERHPADWVTHGRRAGLARNLDMVRLGADCCLAFILDNSPGAMHCAGAAEAAGIPTTRIERTSEAAR